MKIENAPTLTTALNSLIPFSSGGGMSIGELDFDYMQINDDVHGTAAVNRWDGEMEHFDQFFDEAIACLGDMLQKMYGVELNVLTQPLDLLLHSIKEDARQGSQPARVFARKEADHWIFTAFQVFEDNQARIWVAAGAHGPSIEQIMVAINQFAEDSGLVLTQVNAH